MGEIEVKAKRRKRKRDIRFALLAGAKLAALAGAAIAVPNAIQGLYKLGLIDRFNGDVSSINRARQQLIRTGFLLVKNGKLELTQKGRRELLLKEALRAGDVRRRWDGRWRVLIFDIPEHRKSSRDKIRRTLQQVGFVRLQDSVWAYPYDYEDLVVLLKADMKIGKDLLYLVVDEMEGDMNLRKHFGLS